MRMSVTSTWFATHLVRSPRIHSEMSSRVSIVTPRMGTMIDASSVSILQPSGEMSRGFMGV